MPHVDVDREICQNYGQCTFVAPEVFDLDDDGELVYDGDYPDSQQAQVENAVSACPVQAIALREGTP